MSIWTREVDRAFKTYLDNLVSKYLSTKVPVKFINPDIEVNSEEYPCITINSCIAEDYNLKMTDNNSFSVTSNEGLSTITPEPLKYDLEYQIDFYSKSQSLINDLTYMWISTTPKFGTLQVYEKDGSNYYLCPMTQTGYAKLDSVSTGEMIFRRSYSCKVTIQVPTNTALFNKVVGTLEDITTNINK